MAWSSAHREASRTSREAAFPTPEARRQHYHDLAAAGRAAIAERRAAKRAALAELRAAVAAADAALSTIESLGGVR